MSNPYVIGRLNLAIDDIIRQRRWDAYALHRIMLNHFPPEDGTTLSWILDGGSRLSPSITFVTNRKPRINQASADMEVRKFPVDALVKGDKFTFAVNICAYCQKTDENNRKTKVARKDVAEWFAAKSLEEWGFKCLVVTDDADCSANFRRRNKRTDEYENITISGRTVRGVLEIVDEQKFRRAALEGIGARRAFGFGLLRLMARA